MTTTPTPSPAGGEALLARPLSRRRLFEVGGASALLTALLAACGGGGDDGEPGRVGYAPPVTDLADEEIDDVVYLRTLTSLEYSIIGMYQRFQSDGGLEGAAEAALDRFVDDHTATAEQLAQLTVDAGGEAYECPNPWYETRFFGPAMDNIFGNTTTATTVPASDDVARDVVSMMYALESLSTSSFLRFVEMFPTSALRGSSAAFASQAARRAATTALISNPPPAGYVAPTLVAEDAGAEVPVAASEPTASAPIPKVYAITTRFAQLTPVNVEIGAINELGLRYKTTFETPADNAYIYASLSC